MVETLPLCPRESLRKLAQLQIVWQLDDTSRRRVINSSDTELAAVLETGDDSRLVPFLVAALVDLDRRLTELERR
jgi:hypothetical protein